MKAIFKKSSGELQDILTVTSSLGSLNLTKLAVPMFFEVIFNFLIGTVSTIVLSGYSEDAAAATGMASIVINLFSILFTGIAGGCSVLVSNLIGAEHIRKAQSACLSLMLLLAGLGLVCNGVLWLGAPNIATWMNLTGEVHGMAVVYLRGRSLELVFLAGYSILIALMRCYGYSKSAVFIGAITNIVNVLCSIYAVYYAKIEVLSGVSGVALGSALSRFIGCSVAIILFLKYKIKIAVPESFREFCTLVKRALYLGIPTSISNGSFTFSQIVTNSFTALLGVYAGSAKVYFTNILCYAYVFSNCVGMASSILVGRLYGAGNYNHARKLTSTVVKFTVPANGTISALIFLFRIPILSLFTNNQAIINMSFGIMLVDIIIEMARGVSHIYESSLRAVNDVTLTMVVTLASSWTFSVGLGYLLAIPCNMGLLGFWVALAVDEFVRATYTYFRWKSNRWSTKTKI